MTLYTKRRLYADNSLGPEASDAALYSTTVSVSAANMLTSNATPILLVAATGATSYIKVESVIVRVAFNTLAYLTNQSGTAYTDTATVAQFTGPKILAASLSSNIAMAAVPGGGVATETQYIVNKGIYYKTTTGNPDTGNSVVTFFVSYRVIAQP